MDLNNWIRKDGDYLGFALPGADTSLPVWSIVSASTTFRDFADNDTQLDKIWDDRVAYFTAPSVAPTLIASGTSNGTIHANWSYVSGMTKYYVTVYESSGRILTPYNMKRLELTPENQLVAHLTNLKVGETYKVVLLGKNGKGSITTEFTVTVS